MPKLRVETLSGEFREFNGYEAFIPAELSPDNPPVELDSEIGSLLSEADRALGRLDGATSILPDPDLFVMMYIRHEAVRSSQIEGTQSTLEDVLELEAGKSKKRGKKDTQEVLNYIKAMNHGLDRLNDLPLCLRLLREIHENLLQGVRGEKRTPGKFRESQNWIGPSESHIRDAEYIPPPPNIMKEALHNLEKFISNKDRTIPPLIRCGIAHAQFETIHPFLDGNGRVGRLLIVLMLCERGILNSPILYISHFFEINKLEYYERLQQIREKGSWKEWLIYFLEGIIQVSKAATHTTQEIQKMREEHRTLIGQKINSIYAHPLHDFLFEHPYLRISHAENALECSYPTANKLIHEFEELGLLKEVTGQQRNKTYSYFPYVELFDELSLEEVTE